MMINVQRQQWKIVKKKGTSDLEGAGCRVQVTGWKLELFRPCNLQHAPLVNEKLLKKYDED
jgi:hypothetical protein